METPAMPISSSSMLDGSGVTVVRLKLTVPSVLLAESLGPPSNVNVPRKVPTGKWAGTVSTKRLPVKLAPATETAESY